MLILFEPMACCLIDVMTATDSIESKTKGFSVIEKKPAITRGMSYFDVFHITWLIVYRWSIVE